MTSSVEQQHSKFKNVIRNVGVEEAMPIDVSVRDVDQSSGKSHATTSK